MTKRIRLTLFAVAIALVAGCGVLNHDGPNSIVKLDYNFDYPITKDHYFTWINLPGKIKYFTVYNMQTAEATFSSWAVNNQRMFVHSSWPWLEKYTHRSIKPGHFVCKIDNARVKMPVSRVRKFTPYRAYGETVIEILGAEGETHNAVVYESLAKSLGNMEQFVFKRFNQLSGKEEVYSVNNRNIVSIEFEDVEDPTWNTYCNEVFADGRI